jgi:hypothetical protein
MDLYLGIVRGSNLDRDKRFSVGTEENYETFSILFFRCRGRYSKRAPSEYMQEALLLEVACSMTPYQLWISCRVGC